MCVMVCVVVVQGSLSARGQRILFLDADGASEIKDMPHLEKALDEISSNHVRYGHVIDYMLCHTSIILPFFLIIPIN